MKLCPRGAVTADHSVNGALGGFKLWDPVNLHGFISCWTLSVHIVSSWVHTAEPLPGQCCLGRTPLGFSKLQRTYLYLKSMFLTQV